MKIDERSVGDVKILDITGRITIGQGDELLKDKIHSLVHQKHTKILVNLAGVDYVDSTGLGELVGAYTTVARAGGTMKLLNVTRRMHDLLAITKLLTVFETFDSEQEGIKSFG
jgi:anti-sigma B factor antagonist